MWTMIVEIHKVELQKTSKFQIDDEKEKKQFSPENEMYLNWIRNDDGFTVEGGYGYRSFTKN